MFLVKEATMPIKVGINGFGRIGRLVFRAIKKQKADIEVVLVNDLAEAGDLAHLLKYDSVHGRFGGEVKVEGKDMVVDGKTVKLTAEKDPAKLPHKDLGVDVVLESTGVFTTREQMNLHLQAGAKRVLLSAPSKSDTDVDATVVMGVNDSVLTSAVKLVSNASCTTNCLAPMAKAINDAFGIELGLMTTVHGYTNDQRVLDLIHKDRRRMRAAALNIIPTSTGAAKAVGLVLPELKGKLNGFALRVPVPDGSCVDLTIVLKKTLPTDKDEAKKAVNAAVKALSDKMPNILGYTEDKIASSDIIGDSRSSIFDADATMPIAGTNMVKVLSWYDNEWGYSCRCVDLITKMAKL